MPSLCTGLAIILNNGLFIGTTSDVRGLDRTLIGRPPEVDLGRRLLVPIKNYLCNAWAFRDAVCHFRQIAYRTTQMSSGRAYGQILISGFWAKFSFWSFRGFSGGVEVCLRWSFLPPKNGLFGGGGHIEPY